MILFRLFTLAVSFGLGFISYAILDKGRAVVGVLPPAARGQAEAVLAKVLDKPHSALVPALRNLAESEASFSTLKNELKLLQEKLKEANRLRTGEGIPELSEP